MSDQSPAKPNGGWFCKGRSGNPGGRPTASRGPRASAFDVLLEKTLTVPHHGGTREITVEEGVQQRTYRDALAGKRMAQREVSKWIAKREAWLAKHAPRASPRKITLHGGSPDPDRSPRLIPSAMILAATAPNSSLSRGRFRRHCAAGGAANG
jgi:uncharacterized protein DUF5681